jgi:hypothetical protein
MTMPRFTAEASLYERRKSYHMSGVVHASEGVAVLPQARALEKCNARCLGGYFGSAGACFVSGDPDLCMALAGNRYSRCTDFCDLLYG